MSGIGSTSATSSTAQQERVASGNSQQARRHSGDQKIFANMLAAAAESAPAEASADARKKSRGQNDESDSEARQLPGDGRQVLVADTPDRTAHMVHPAPDGQQTEQESSPSTAQTSRNPRTGLSMMTLLARDAQTAARQLRAGATDTPAADGSSATNTVLGGEMWPGTLGQALGGVEAGETTLSVALTAALEDALDVADDVTQLASTVMERLGGDLSSDGAGADIGAVAHEGVAERNLNTAGEAAPAAAQGWQDAWNEAMDKIGQQVNYWLGKGVTQAQLTVHGGQGEAVDVRVLLRDGQAHLEFATDNALTRDNITEHGTEALRAALAQSGIDLASLTVDSQSAGGQNPDNSSPRDTAARSARDSHPAMDVQPASMADKDAMVNVGSRSLLDAYA